MSTTNDSDIQPIVDAVQTKMAELTGQLETKQGELEKALEKYDGQLAESKSVDESIRSEVKSLAGEFKDLNAKIIDLQQKAAGGYGSQKQTKTWGGTLIDSDQFTALKSGSSGRVRIEVKNTILGEGGSPQDPVNTLVPEDRRPGIVPGQFRSLSILDVIPPGSTSSNQVTYTRELSWTNNAAEKAEGTDKPESALTFELVEEPVRTIAHFIKASRQVLDDAPALQSYIDVRLRHGLRNRLQTQILNGNGTSPNLEGITSSGRSTAFAATTGENELDSLNRMKYAVIGDDYEANLIMINPADWGNIERLKDTAGNYIAGGGAALSYINNGMTPLVWGIPVIANNAVTSGTAIVLDINQLQLFTRQDAVVEIFEQDTDNVQKNLLTIRAEMRAALASYAAPAIRVGEMVVT